MQGRGKRKRPAASAHLDCAFLESPGSEKEQAGILVRRCSAHGLDDDGSMAGGNGLHAGDAPHAFQIEAGRRPGECAGDHARRMRERDVNGAVFRAVRRRTVGRRLEPGEAFVSQAHAEHLKGEQPRGHALETVLSVREARKPAAGGLGERGFECADSIGGQFGETRDRDCACQNAAGLEQVRQGSFGGMGPA